MSELGKVWQVCDKSGFIWAPRRRAVHHTNAWLAHVYVKESNANKLTSQVFICIEDIVIKICIKLEHYLYVYVKLTNYLYILYEQTSRKSTINIVINNFS